MKEESKSAIADGLSERSKIGGVAGSEQDRFGPNQLPKKESEKVNRDGMSVTIT